jgi:hypothetical protein
MDFAGIKEALPHWLRILSVFTGLMLLPFSVVAGSLDSPAAPTDAASAMYSLESLYDRLNGGSAGAKRSGAFAEPSSGPGATGYSLDEIMAKMPAADNTDGAVPADVASGKTFWGLRTDGSWGPQTGTSTGGGGGGPANPAPVAKTGQTTSYATGDDGNLKVGAAPTGPRFTDNGDGTVTDNLTGLIWLQDANCYGVVNWSTALGNANNLGTGTCGLTDGSAAGDWRLPNVNELDSLVDFGNTGPSLPSGHPFTSFSTSLLYWTSTTVAVSSTYAWAIDFPYGERRYKTKTSSYYVLPVRGE